MFCPNCGNNCGDTRFCSSCGTQLQQAAAPATQSGEWKVGMPCPNCGGTQLDGEKCAFCGAHLVVNVDVSVKNTYPIPYGFHQGTLSYIDLRENHLIIGSTTSVYPKHQTVENSVPYSDLRKVVMYKYGKNIFNAGFLTIRWGDNIHIPIPSNYLEAATDFATVSICRIDAEVFKQIYHALKAIIDNNLE